MTAQKHAISRFLKILSYNNLPLNPRYVDLVFFFENPNIDDM